ncbi:hypothetical protein RCOM_0903910 [Ricinus communis]|uniref:Rhamnogalacturonan lyase domain-containing protein n=1 Tax=Ricinus communis TaxID=3988 RepID=B9RXJ4_RICCO|nr:hypothetical protein RCOM_0903910 [Ricinus communis]
MNPRQSFTSQVRGLYRDVYTVVERSNGRLEVSFKNTYNPSVGETRLPLTIDISYILRSGVSGFNCFAVYERPAFDLAQTRMVFKLRREVNLILRISDEKQRIMPMPEDLLPGRDKQLIVPESFLLVNPINPDIGGEVDDKYQYSVDNKDGGIHGWISSDPIVGFWIIFPSHEDRNGGPTKQNLTAHTGPYCLARFHGTHYIGHDIIAHFQEGEEWRKVQAIWLVGQIHRYTSESDHTFIIGISDPKKDWFFTQVDRRGADKYLPIKWIIKFKLDSVATGTYKLRLAIASATHSNLEVYVNDMDVQHMVFRVMNLGTDNTVHRHGIHELYNLFSIDISSSMLTEGDSSMFLAKARGTLRTSV